MSSFIIFNNVHLGLELVGAIIFFILAWLFLEAYLIKKDLFSISRSLGFLLLSLGHVFHAIYSSGLNWTPLIYTLGMILLILSYGLEKMPGRPNGSSFVFLPFVAVFAQPLIIFFLNVVFVLILTKRYFKDIEKLLKPLIIGFLFLTASSLLPLFYSPGVFGSLWILEHAFRLAGFFGAGFLAWQLLSLRIRDEAFIVFVGVSLFIALLVTTIFSAVFLKRVEDEAEFKLSASAKIFSFYLESLKSRALSAAQIIAADQDFVSAFRNRDFADLEKVAGKFVAENSLQFLTVASPNGSVIFKLNFPAVTGENIAAENLGVEALEGKPGSAIGTSESEGLSIRAASPIFDKGKVSGVVIIGNLLDSEFLKRFKSQISDFQSSIFVDDAVAVSTIFKPGDKFYGPKIKESLKDGKEFLGSAEFFGEEVIGSFSPLQAAANQTIMFALTTTPGELLEKVQGTNRLTLLLVSLIILALIIPLYRFTIFLTT